MKNDVSDLFAAPILALLFSGIGYLWARTSRRGKPLTRLQRRMILYATTFILGAAYAILFQEGLGVFLHWREAWIAAIILWAALLAVIAWRGANRASDTPSEE